MIPRLHAPPWRRLRAVVVRVILILVIYSVPSISQAQTQFSTFPGDFPDYLNIGPLGGGVEALWRVAFVTDSNTYVLNSITLGMTTRTEAPVTFTGGLYLGLPGDQVSLTPLDPNTILAPYTPSRLTLTSGYQILLPNTRYTAVFHSDLLASVLYGYSPATGRWSLARPPSTYGFSYYSVNGGSSWGGMSPPLAFSVDASVLPEPSSAALILILIALTPLRSVGLSGRTRGPAALLVGIHSNLLARKPSIFVLDHLTSRCTLGLAEVDNE
jgi:hypothetical protein